MCLQITLQTALDVYNDAIRLDPLNHVLFANRSAILLKLDRHSGALADACKSLSINREWPKVCPPAQLV